MIEVTRTRELDASAESAWATVGDFSAVGRYLDNIAECVLDGARGPGQTRRLTLTDGGLTVSECTALDDTARIVSYRILTTALPLADYSSTQTVTPIGDRRCEVQWVSRFVPDGTTEAEARDFIGMQLESGLAILAKHVESATVEVFADVHCPFAHVGLKRVSAHLNAQCPDVALVVRAWPLEWVNGSPLEVGPVSTKVAALRQQLGVSDFDGFRADTWPSTTIGALNLAAQAYAEDATAGLAVSLAVRAALFEHGRDISDPVVLAELAQHHGLEAPAPEANQRVKADYAQGQARGVRGSPHYFVGEYDFFCPSLDIGHDGARELTAAFDTAGMDAFLVKVSELDR